MNPTADPSSSPPRADRQVRVFISSTFRDMMRERDLLVKEVFPALRRKCATRFVTFTEVDLRWGIAVLLRGPWLVSELRPFDDDQGRPEQSRGAAVVAWRNAPRTWETTCSRQYRCGSPRLRRGAGRRRGSHFLLWPQKKFTLS